MADKARRATDKRLKEIEEKLVDVYTQAEKEMRKKWDEYMAQGQARLDNLYALYKSAPEGDEKKTALKKYQDAFQSFTLKNRWYSDMVNQITFHLAQTNDLAVKYINGQLSDIYRWNYNQSIPEIANTKIRFDIVDEATVKRLIEQGEIVLPKKKVDYAKDMTWNRRQINSSILQGILQGESVDQIAKRLMPIVNNNRKAAYRTARTLITGSENRGRLDRYKDLESQGAIMHKIWIATADGRTRDWHIDIDGQEVPIDDVFIDGHGNELEYPGDPGAEPETVYNCRCSMRSQFIGMRQPNGRIRYMPQHEHNGLHQKQIADERRRREEEEG